MNAPITDPKQTIEEATGAGPVEEGGTKRTLADERQADALVTLASRAHLFHTPDDRGFADLVLDGHRETWPITGRGFKQWLAKRYYETAERAPNSEALRTALNVIEAKARYDGPEQEIYVRVASHDAKHYLDLANAAWQAIEIDEAGWRIVDRPPVRFRRPAGMRPLPQPEPGGGIDMLREFLNLADDDQFVLVAAWALAALRDTGPYPVIVLGGEQGTAKSTFASVLKALLDPGTPPLRALPREDRDLFIAAGNSHVIAFDNVSLLRDWISDTLCRLATGGGFAVRQLFTDQDEVLFDAMRPIILNGIEDIATRGDLADRALFFHLTQIPDGKRRPEKRFWADFERARPLILGALLDAVSLGLRRLPHVALDELPRMADFAEWGIACDEALGGTGVFRRAYERNRRGGVDNVIEADLIATALCSYMESHTTWEGTSTDLLEALEANTTERIRRSKTWPGNPRALSGRLRRAAPNLRKVGITIAEGRGRRGLLITRDQRVGNFASVASEVGQGAHDPKRSAADGDAMADATDATDANLHILVAPDPEADRVDADERAAIKEIDGEEDLSALLDIPDFLRREAAR